MSRTALWLAAALLLLGARFDDRPDRDGDGVADDRDLCAFTPERATPIAHGCAAAELVASPEIVGGAARTAMDVAAEGIALDLTRSYNREAVLMRRGLETARGGLDSALVQLGRGDPCASAETMGEVRDAVESLSSRSHELILATREELSGEVSPDDPDSDFLEVAFHELAYRASLVGRALVAVREAHAVADDVCGQVVRDWHWQGIIARTDDAGRFVELRNGTRLVVPPGSSTTTLREGAHVRIHGTLLADSMGIATDFAPLGRDPRVLSVSSIPPILLQCIKLQIAPFQPFNPPLPVSPNYVLHNVQGYTGQFLGSPILELEAPMRLAAALTGACPQPSGPGKVNTYRYSLKLEFKTASSSFEEFSSDLVPTDNPVALPPEAIPTDSAAASGTLRVTEQVQKCIGRFPRQRCSSTVKPLRTTDYVVLVLQQGAYGSFQYTTTLFDLADGDTTGFRVATVQGLTTSPFLSGHPAVFDAEGYSASGAKVVETITPGNPSFAIYQDDFFNPELIAGFASEGTTQRSGLRWPRVVGTRNGWPFWYSATLPTIVRDLVHLCNPGPHSFYRLPWTNNVTKNTGQGNSTSGSHGTGSSQEFAFDFGLSDGNSIRATRGGKVEWLTETQTANFNPNQPVSPSNQPFPQGSLQNWGNAVRIAHQDGTFAWYFHIKTNRVFVNVGETVVRGQVIAEADNTGRSTDAHLHYQVQDNNANWGQSIQIRFDTASHGSCYIPVTGDDVTSNNTFGS